MALPDVFLTITNGNLKALLALADGVCGYTLTGVSAGTIVQGTPIHITSFDDAVTKGLANATNPFAYKVIKEHYDQAPGTELYLMLVAPTMTVNLMCDKTNANGSIKLLDFAAGAVRLNLCMDDPTSHTVTVTNGLDANVYTAITNMQALAVQYAGVGKQAPFWGIIGGTGFNGTETALTDQTASTNNYVSVMIGDTASGNSCALGLLGGMLANLPVQRKASRVKNNAIVISGNTAYIGTVLAEKFAGTATIHDRGFITLRKFPNKNGYFFTSDTTCTASTDDYKAGARRRVMNKIQIIAYATLLNEVDDEVDTDPDTGLIDPSYALYLQDLVDTQVNGIMTANNEITAFKSYVDPNQNPITANGTKIVLGAVPKGYNSTINGTLQFVQSL